LSDDLSKTPIDLDNDIESDVKRNYDLIRATSKTRVIEELNNTYIDNQKQYQRFIDYHETLFNRMVQRNDKTFSKEPVF
jgi:HSP90 family molecular chaperone